MLLFLKVFDIDAGDPEWGVGSGGIHLDRAGEVAALDQVGDVGLGAVQEGSDFVGGEVGDIVGHDDSVNDVSMDVKGGR